MSTAVLRSSGAAASEDRYAHKYIIAATVTMAAMLELIDTSIVNVAIPHMMGNLGATLDEIAWVSTGYIIANVIVIPLSSWLSSSFGRKERELRSGRAADARDLAFAHASAVRINLELHGLAGTDLVELRLLEVGRHPHAGVGYDDHERLARGDELSDFHLLS